MKYIKNILISTFATIGAVNTVMYIKQFIQEIYENQMEKNDISKKLEELDDKIKYVENVSGRIEHIQYTLLELRNILSKPTSEETLYELKSSNYEFTNELLN